MAKISQMYSAFGWHLKANLKKKYNLSEARDRNKPILFFGCYGSQIKTALKWAEKTKVLIWWSGSDITYVFRNNDYAGIVRNHPNIYHIATNSFIEKDLKLLNFKYKKVPLISQFIDDFKPCPLGDAIYIYKARQAGYCGRDNFRKIETAFPNQRFIIANSHHVMTQQQLKEAYKDSYLSLRLLAHDGLSHTVCELGLMGRKVIYNGDTPNSINFTNINDVINSIGQVATTGYDPYKVAQEMYDYLNVGEDWLNTEYYE